MKRNNYRRGTPASLNYIQKQRRKEKTSGGFRCSHCKWFVVSNSAIGTANRNHCNICLWSLHVDEAKGDRRATCKGGMQPIGLTFKHAGYGKQGEVMVIHHCLSCGKLSINRIARDDSEQKLLCVFEQSFALCNELRDRLKHSDIYLLCQRDSEQLQRQLFGG